MKKIFTLLFAAGLFTLAQAQPGTKGNRQNDQRDFDKGKDIAVNHNPYDNDDDRYGNDRFSNERKMKMQIARINREFDYKIQRVRNSFYMSRWEKQRQIRFLQHQRQQEIRMVYAKFSKKNHRGDRDDRSYRRY